MKRWMESENTLSDELLVYSRKASISYKQFFYDDIVITIIFYRFFIIYILFQTNYHQEISFWKEL